MTIRLAIALFVLSCGVASAQGLLQGGLDPDDPLRIAPGALLIHGNYCGPGNNGPGHPPIDALDAACMRHDACTPDDGPPTCDCNARLAFEAHAISMSPRYAPELRSLAGTVEHFVPLIPCEG